MRNIPTDLLRAFVTVVDAGGFTAAADILGRSQPAVSLQLKRMQDVIGHRLLERRGAQLLLTDQGHVVYRYAKQILALNDQLLAEFHTTSVIGRVHLGIPSEFASTVLPKIVGRFARAYPNITLEVTSALSTDLLAEPKRSTFDLVLALHDNPEAAGADLVKEEELVWVGNNGADLESPLPLVVAPDGCVYRARALARLGAEGHPWRVIYTNPDLAGITAALDEGLGITPLAISTVPDSQTILKPNDRLPALGTVGVSLARPSNNQSEAVQLLADYVLSYLRR